MSDATLFRFISSYRDELDFRHTASGRRYRVSVHDPARRPHPSDGLPIGAEVTGEWHRYRIAARASHTSSLDADLYVVSLCRARIRASR